MITEQHARVNILGVGISAVSMEDALKRTDAFMTSSDRGYVCITGVHGIMEAQEDERFRTILNRSMMSTPDGMPTVWLGRFHGFNEMTRVYGPDYMVNVCERSVERGYRHFLYGGKPGIAEELKAELQRRFPGLQVAGTYTPPFRPLNAQEEAALFEQLHEARVDVLWCGLSTPKQERFMAEYVGRLPVKLMVGVGAAFDLVTGNLSEAPDWMKNAGLQWFYRLLKEPKRLWKRYLINNPRFLWLILLQTVRLRRYSLR